MNFCDFYFSESKKKKKKKKTNKKGKPVGKSFSMASFFDSRKYDKGVHGTLDLNLIGL